MTTEVSLCECTIFKCFDVNIKHQDDYYKIVIYYYVYKEPQYNSDWSKRWVMIQNYNGDYNLCLSFCIIKNISKYL